MIYPLRTLGHFAAATAATALILCGSLADKATANANHHMRYTYAYGYLQRDYGVGWGWDSVYGYYKGPIFRGNTGYFRCFEPGYGCHPCPNYWIVPVRRHWW